MIVNPLKSYVLRSGRITEAQNRALTQLYCKYCIPFSLSGRTSCTPSIEAHVVSAAVNFNNNNPLIVEIGFGMGIATADIAEANPTLNYIAIEVFRAGIGKLLLEIEKRKLMNIRIIEADAVEVLENIIADNSISAFHIFFPDPWPKKRHHKRRLLKKPFTNTLQKKLRRGGYLYIVTDWEPYAEFIIEELNSTEGLENPYSANPGGYACKQSWRTETKFEKKGIDKEHKIREIYYKKGEVQ